jgi:hypothetical protein
MYGDAFCKTRASTNCCPAGYQVIDTLADCVMALHDTYEWGAPSPDYLMAPEAEATRPYGCYVYADGWNTFYFNEDPFGAANAKATPVCKKSKTTIG